MKYHIQGTSKADSVPVISVNILVINIIPTPIRSAALARLTQGSHLRNFLNTTKNFSTAIVDKIKGIANPAEYTANRLIPVIRDELDAAMVNMLAKIGPMQGVQPAPNPIPIMNEPI
jgi:hypothetical protein